MELTSPWRGVALVNENNYLLDPRIMEALEAALPSATPEEIEAAVEAYLDANPGMVGSSNNTVTDIVKMSQAEYDSLPTPSPTTLYVIV